MATPAQVIANQANSKNSTGPVTDEGKAKSSRNRLSHGFASSTRFIPGEDPEQFKALLIGLMREYQPSTPTQQILVEMMAHHRWVGLRAARIEGDIMAGMAAVGDVIRTLPLMIRYHTTAERAFHKAHEELLKAQKQMANREIGFESQKTSPADGIGPQASDSIPKSPSRAPKPTNSSPKLTPDAEAEALMAYIDQKWGASMASAFDGIRPDGL